jgi:hypothetical protein
LPADPTVTAVNTAATISNNVSIPNEVIQRSLCDLK